MHETAQRLRMEQRAGELVRRARASALAAAIEASRRGERRTYLAEHRLRALAQP
jgi:hypothetical protein